MASELPPRAYLDDTTKAGLKVFGEAWYNVRDFLANTGDKAGETLNLSEIKSAAEDLGVVIQDDGLLSKKVEDLWWFMIFKHEYMTGNKWHKKFVQIKHHVMQPRAEGSAPVMATYNEEDIEGIMYSHSLAIRETADKLLSAHGLDIWLKRLMYLKGDDILTAKQQICRAILQSPMKYMPDFLFHQRQPNIKPSAARVIARMHGNVGILGHKQGIFRINHEVRNIERKNNVYTDVVVLPNGAKTAILFGKDYMTTQSESGGAPLRRMNPDNDFLSQSLGGKVPVEDDLYLIKNLGNTYHDFLNRRAIYSTYAKLCYDDGHMFDGEKLYRTFSTPSLEVRDMSSPKEWRTLTFEELIEHNHRFGPNGMMNYAHHGGYHSADTYNYEYAPDIFAPSTCFGEIGKGLPNDHIAMHAHLANKMLMSDATFSQAFIALITTLNASLDAYYGAIKSDLANANPSIVLPASKGYAALFTATMSGLPLTAVRKPLLGDGKPAADAKHYPIRVDYATGTIYYCADSYGTIKAIKTQGLFEADGLLAKENAGANPLDALVPNEIMNGGDIDENDVKYMTTAYAISIMRAGVKFIQAETDKTGFTAKVKKFHDPANNTIRNAAQKVWTDATAVVNKINEFYKQATNIQVIKFLEYYLRTEKSVKASSVLWASYQTLDSVANVAAGFEDKYSDMLVKDVATFKDNNVAFGGSNKGQDAADYNANLNAAFPDATNIYKTSMNEMNAYSEPLMKKVLDQYKLAEAANSNTYKLAAQFAFGISKTDPAYALAAYVFGTTSSRYQVPSVFVQPGDSSNVFLPKHCESRLEEISLSPLIPKGRVNEARALVLGLMASAVTKKLVGILAKMNLPNVMGTQVVLCPHVIMNLQCAIWAQKGAGRYMTRSEDLNLEFARDNYHKIVVAHYSKWHDSAIINKNAIIVIPDLKFNGLEKGLSATNYLETDIDFRRSALHRDDKQGVIVMDVGFVSRADFDAKWSAFTFYPIPLNALKWLVGRVATDSNNEKLPNIDYYNQLYKFVDEHEKNNGFSVNDFSNMTPQSYPAAAAEMRHHIVLGPSNKVVHKGFDFGGNDEFIEKKLDGNIDYSN